MRAKTVCIAALSLWWSAAHADAIDIANRLRASDCNPAVQLRALVDDARLTAIAERWSNGGRLNDAISHTFAQARFQSLQLSGVRDEAVLAGTLRQQWCATLTDADFTRFGAYRRGDRYWLVVATGDASPQRADAETVRNLALRFVNEARARSRRCGAQRFKAAPSLRSNEALSRAAEIHARDMAEHRKLQHEGFDGSTPAERARAAGYVWRAIGENIGAGPTGAREVVDLWLNSPPHCANIMSADYTEMGLAFATDGNGESGVYWAQEFGAPR